MLKISLTTFIESFGKTKKITPQQWAQL
ncbi:hypothetical protein BCEN4_740072 [Burkholderia cenocepacia]|nr:hypothetical protein BCEN4_740072 [Burkholderia cenocepacia]